MGDMFIMSSSVSFFIVEEQFATLLQNYFKSLRIVSIYFLLRSFFGISNRLRYGLYWGGFSHSFVDLQLVLRYLFEAKFKRATRLAQI